MTQVLQKVIVNNCRNECPFNIDEVERTKHAKFVGMLPLKDINGNWINEPSSIFWQPTPPVAGYSHYFALVNRNGKCFITSGQTAVDGIINGMLANDGEIIYSNCRWDNRTSRDGSANIDGGRDYVKCNRGGKIIELVIVDGEFYSVDNVVDNPQLPA